MQTTTARSRRFLAPLHTIAVASLLSSLTAQNPTPAEVFRAFTVSGGSLQRIHAEPKRTAHRVILAVNGARRVLELRPHDLRAHDFKVLLDDGRTSTVAPPMPVSTFRGTVIDDPGSLVAASWIDGQLHATIHTSRGAFGVQPVRTQFENADRDLYLVYRTTDVTARGQLGTAPSPLPRTDPGPITANANATHKLAELALDCDNAFYKRHGSSAAATQAEVMKHVNAMELIFARDVAIRYKVTAIVIRTSPVYKSTSMTGLLPEMRNYWIANHGSIRRDLAQMFTGQTYTSSLWTYVYRSSVCNSSIGYGLLKGYQNGDVLNTALLAWCCGTSFAGQCDTTKPPCYILCRTIGGCNRDLTRFGPHAISLMKAFISKLTCLDSFPNAGDYTYFGKACGRLFQTPKLRCIVLPMIGKTFDLRVEYATGGRLALYAFGASQKQWGTIPLPLDLKPIGATGCQLLVSPDALIGTRTDFFGIANLRVAIPNNTSFIGTTFFNQVMVHDPLANAAGISLTDGGAGTVGR